MFENIIRQEEAIELLRDDCTGGRLPSSLLFSGPEFSGKLSAALELARVLSCAGKDAPWNCGCRSCESHRLLVNPYTQMLGGRYFYQDIAACADTLKKSGNLSARYLFIRSVRKLTRRFDPVLWEGDESKLSKIQGHLNGVEEILMELSPGQNTPREEDFDKPVEKVLSAVGKILDAVNLDSIPIAMVRRASSWAHFGASGAGKFIILENADRMLESARNALLKILEEPPAHVHFVLLTSRRSAIIPTILSRVRTYSFGERDPAAAREVLERIFRETSGEFAGLKEFFWVFGDVNPHALRAAALGFLRCARETGPLGCRDFTGALPEDPAYFQDRAKFRLFLEELLKILREALRGGTEAGGMVDLPLHKMEEWAKLIRKTVESMEILNLSPSLLGQRLFTLFGR
jgi:DNA polymerase-3 subunit gamma/tau